jgi:tetratricopeptide (TPR) repeat protein
MHYSGMTTEKHRLYIEAHYARRMENDSNKAISIVEELVSKYPKEKAAYLMMVIYMRDQEDFTRAIDILDKALVLDPDFAYAVNMMGYLHMEIMDYSKALGYFRRYASLTPGDPNPWDSMGDCLYRMGRTDDSKESYRKAIEISPDYFSSLMCISYLYAIEGDYDSALYWIDGAIEVAWSPGYKSIGVLSSASCLRIMGRHVEAAKREDLAHEYMLSSTHPMREVFAKAFKVSHLYLEGEYDKSLEAIDYYMKRVEELDLETPITAQIEMIAYKGLNALGNGRPDKARAAVEEMDALLSSPSFEKERITAKRVRRVPVLLEAEVLLAESRPAEAIAFMAAKDTMYTPTLIYYEVGYYNVPPEQDVVARAHTALGENARAIEEYERMLTFDPASADRRMRVPIYHYRVAVLYEEEGRYDLAMENYEKYLEIMKHADDGIAEVEDTRRRLEKLRSASSVTGS